jgi:CBS domain containing-hemolysin-like protein
MIVALLVVNGFFVAAEFALVKVPAIRIGEQAAAGHMLARITSQIQQNLEAFLAACQLGITMASLGLGWIGEPAVAHILEPLFRNWGMSEESLHTVAFLIGFVIFSSLHIVIGEQVPKTYAIRRAEQVSYWIAIPLLAFYWLAFPLNWILNKSSSLVLRGIGVAEVSHLEVMTGSEIRGMIDVSTQHGAIENNKARMLQNLFRFDERAISRIMLPRSEIDYLEIDMSIDKVLAVIDETRHSRLPVIGSSFEDVRGVILVKELLRRLIEKPDDLLKDCLDVLRPSQLVPDTQPINVLFDQMLVSREHMALVVDEYGQLSGLVTMEDLLEEIVGEIADESDDDEQAFAVVAEGEGWRAHGFTTIDDLRRITGFQPASELTANTVSGLIMQRLERVPVTGDVIEENGFRFSITSVEGSRVQEAEIERVEDDEGAKTET